MTGIDIDRVLIKRAVRRDPQSPYTFVVAGHDDTNAAPGPFDVISCLSVTKWIHLAQGDAGIRRLFHTAHERLRPGGFLILEPQPWRSYKKRRTQSADIAQQFASIRLRPDAFPGELARIGFRLLHKCTNVPAATPGYSRPLLVFQKAPVCAAST